jgi:ubiquitin-protein ligase
MFYLKTDIKHNLYEQYASMASSQTPAPVFISKETTLRLLRDVREMMTVPEEGIFYKHSETDMLCGYALIVGPEGSLYDGGYYFYKFKFPPDYPHSPPVVEFLTNDGETRMHPNMYKNRKMCVSILNTWRGDQWTGCQTIKSVLITIMSLLDDKPLLHEPGITRQNPDYEPYNRIIQYKNYRFCMLQLLQSIDEFKTVIPDIGFHEQFYEHMCASFRKSHSRYSASIDALLLAHPQVEFVRTTQAYQMTITVNYPLLKISFEEAVKRLVD